MRCPRPSPGLKAFPPYAVIATRSSKLAAAAGHGRRFGLRGELGMRPDIGVDMARQYFGAVDEEMVGARDLAEIDLDVTLVRQLVDQLLHRLRRNQGVLVALQDQPGRRAG